MQEKVISGSQGILNKLDMAHRMQFPIIVTYNYTCDMRVVKLLRQRGLGNSTAPPSYRTHCPLSDRLPDFCEGK